jgi:hypothetical protein
MTSPARRASQAKYYASAKGRAARAKREASPERRAARAKYHASPEGRAARANYEASIDGRAARAKHASSPRRRKVIRRSRDKRLGIDHAGAEILRAAVCACQICGAAATELHVDHCHLTSALRGRLCGSCNRALGLFRDSPELLRRAAEYLIEPPTLSMLK